MSFPYPGIHIKISHIGLTIFNDFDMLHLVSKNQTVATSDDIDNEQN